MHIWKTCRREGRVDLRGRGNSFSLFFCFVSCACCSLPAPLSRRSAYLFRVLYSISVVFLRSLRSFAHPRASAIPPYPSLFAPSFLC